jgi:hypothetical protein
VITGTALLAFAAGWALLVMRSMRTAQPQHAPSPPCVRAPLPQSAR